MEGLNAWQPCAVDVETVYVELRDGVTASLVLGHPRHRAAQLGITGLITQLRACESVEDGYALQDDLRDHILQVESDRNKFSRAVKRLRVSRAPQLSAPEPQSGLDPSLRETWELERDLCERIARQYRCVGDALAWRVFGFQRREIIARCQNASPGVMAGKDGLEAELAEIEKARADGVFAIQHDLTNCLRIGDMTIFPNDGTFETIEVKTDAARRSAAQRRRILVAQAATREGGPLTGSDRRSRLYDLDVPYRNHLKVLADGVVKAAEDGYFTAKLPGDRVLLVSDLYGYSQQGYGDDDEWPALIERRYAAARRRAGLGTDRTWNIHATSLDSVSRDPTRVPFAAYPLPPWACARIIGDLAAFHVETNAKALERSVRAAGIDAQWVRPAGGSELAPGEVLMEMTARTSVPAPAGLQVAMHRGSLRMENVRTLQMRRSDLDKYLIEMLDQRTWVQGIRHMLADQSLDGRPWPHCRGEDEVWV
jgi:hypothetical protein